jgi:hypothetical protein
MLLIAMTARLTGSKKPKSVQIAFVCLSNKLKSVAAAIENMNQSFGDIAQPQV